MTPIECLEKQLDVWLSAKRHAERSFKMGTITLGHHKAYLDNLNPKIKQYEAAIKVLQKNGFK